MKPSSLPTVMYDDWMIVLHPADIMSARKGVELGRWFSRKSKSRAHSVKSNQKALKIMMKSLTHKFVSK